MSYVFGPKGSDEILAPGIRIWACGPKVDGIDVAR